MKPPVGPSNVARPTSSVAVDSDGSAAFDVATFLMISAALWPASESIATVASRPLSLLVMMLPPADTIRALTQTMYPSYRLPCSAIVVLVLSAASSIWSQVNVGDVGSTPAFWTTDLRYQSSWVLATYGAPTSWPFQVALSIGDFRTSLRISGFSASVNGRSQPALASSGMYGGSTLTRSIEESLAASRRTICSRWPS